MKDKIQKKLIIPIWLLFVVIMMILGGIKMSQGYDQITYPDGIFGDKVMVKTKTKWGDIFTVISEVDSRNTGLHTAILYDKNKNEIVQSISVESDMNLLESSMDYPKGKWITPILNNEDIRSYLFMEGIIVYFDKSMETYHSYLHKDGMIPYNLQSSIEKVIEMNVMTDTSNRLYQEKLDERLGNSADNEQKKAAEIVPTSQMTTYTMPQAKERMMSMTNTRIFEILGKQEQTEEELLHRLYSVFQFSDANYTYTKTKQDIIRGLQDLSWISNTNLALVVWNATDYLQQESMNDILLSLEKEVVEYWKQKQEHHFSILLVESI